LNENATASAVQALLRNVTTVDNSSVDHGNVRPGNSLTRALRDMHKNDAVDELFACIDRWI
jgi:hypothetical protein